LSVGHARQRVDGVTEATAGAGVEGAGAGIDAIASLFALRVAVAVDG
jgi:hypothetical protein